MQLRSPVKDKLDNCIHEYLQFHGYLRTCCEFEKERKKQKELALNMEAESDAMKNNILQHIAELFANNEYEQLLSIWIRYLPKDTLDHNAQAIRIECQLQILKFLHSSNDIQSRNDLHSFFKINGNRLTLCQDLLPYFSLPFIEKFETHPLFTSFYDRAFVDSICKDLSECMMTSLSDMKVPKLHCFAEGLKCAPSLDYGQIKKALSVKIKSDVSKKQEMDLLLLLQALRWRVSHTRDTEEKKHTILRYIREGIVSLPIICSLLCSANHHITEGCLRFLNTMSWFAVGRNYLVKLEPTKLIDVLCDILTSTTGDDPIRRYALAVLQRLSVDRHVVDTMMNKGLIGWIIGMLDEDLDEISQYTVIYATALLMNLILTNKGRKQCSLQLNEQHISKILDILMNLLNSRFVAQIFTHCNAVLHSMLSESSIQKIAIKNHLGKRLMECLSNLNDPSFTQQIRCIITHISTPPMNQTHINVDDESEDSDNNEATSEDFEENDVDELRDYFTKQNAAHLQYMQGEELLLAEYSVCL